MQRILLRISILFGPSHTSSFFQWPLWSPLGSMHIYFFCRPENNLSFSFAPECGPVRVRLQECRWHLQHLERVSISAGRALTKISSSIIGAPKLCWVLSAFKLTSKIKPFDLHSSVRTRTMLDNGAKTLDTIDNIQNS